MPSISPDSHLAALNSALQHLYHETACNCPECQQTITLKAEVRSKVYKAAEKAYKALYKKGSYKPEDLVKVKEYNSLIEATKSAFSPAIVEEVPEEMKKRLSNDIFLFSGLRTHAQLFEASRAIADDQGRKRPFVDFAADVLKLNEKYNVNYLETEHQFAYASTQMAAKWSAVDITSDRYDLQYRTAGDNKVSVDHARMQDITLPPSDPFWTYYYPPNRWKCRCNAVEVRKGKYQVSDPNEAMAAGEKATTAIGKDGSNKLAIFRFNPGKQEVVFPPAHPYNKVAGADIVKKAIQPKIEK